MTISVARRTFGNNESTNAYRVRDRRGQNSQMMRGREQEREVEKGESGTGKPEDERERNCQIGGGGDSRGASGDRRDMRLGGQKTQRTSTRHDVQRIAIHSNVAREQTQAVVHQRGRHPYVPVQWANRMSASLRVHTRETNLVVLSNLAVRRVESLVDTEGLLGGCFHEDASRCFSRSRPTA
jgi:hypothetical protein